MKTNKRTRHLERRPKTDLVTIVTAEGIPRNITTWPYSTDKLRRAELERAKVTRMWRT